MRFAMNCSAPNARSCLSSSLGGLRKSGYQDVWQEHWARHPEAWIFLPELSASWSLGCHRPSLGTRLCFSERVLEFLLGPMTLICEHNARLRDV